MRGINKRVMRNDITTHITKHNNIGYPTLTVCMLCGSVCAEIEDRRPLPRKIRKTNTQTADKR